MTRAYSIDLRWRVVEAVLSGATVREAAGRFGVSMSCAVKWSQRYRTTGDVGPEKVGGHKRPILAGDIRAWLLHRITEKPDLTVRALQSELAERGIKVGHNTVWLCLRSEGLSCKKNRVSPRARAAQSCAASDTMESLPASH